MITQAKEKIKNLDMKKLQKYKHAAAVAENVQNALIYFCEQNEEFARAVLQGGSITDCLIEVDKKINGRNYVSDLDVYNFAVNFFFSGAKIEFKMIIHMSEYELNQKEQNENSLDLSLSGLLDW